MFAEKYLKNIPNTFSLVRPLIIFLEIFSRKVFPPDCLFAEKPTTAYHPFLTQSHQLSVDVDNGADFFNFYNLYNLYNLYNDQNPFLTQSPQLSVLHKYDEYHECHSTCDDDGLQNYCLEKLGSGYA